MMLLLALLGSAQSFELRSELGLGSRLYAPLKFKQHGEQYLRSGWAPSPVVHGALKLPAFEGKYEVRPYIQIAPYTYQFEFDFTVAEDNVLGDIGRIDHSEQEFFVPQVTFGTEFLKPFQVNLSHKKVLLGVGFNVHYVPPYGSSSGLSYQVIKNGDTSSLRAFRRTLELDDHVLHLNGSLIAAYEFGKNRAQRINLTLNISMDPVVTGYYNFNVLPLKSFGEIEARNTFVSLYYSVDLRRRSESNVITDPSF